MTPALQSTARERLQAFVDLERLHAAAFHDNEGIQQGLVTLLDLEFLTVSILLKRHVADLATVEAWSCKAY